MQFTIKTVLISTLFFFGSSSVLAAQESTSSNEERQNHIANLDLNIPNLIQAGLHMKRAEDEAAKRLIIPSIISSLLSGKEGEISARDENDMAAKRLIIPALLSQVLGGKEGADIVARNEDDMMAEKRLIPGLLEKIFGKEAVESVKRDAALAQVHPFSVWNSNWHGLPKMAMAQRDIISQLNVPDLLNLNADIKTSKRDVEENSKRLLLPLLISQLAGKKEGEVDDETNGAQKRLLLPMLISQLAGKKEGDVQDDTDAHQKRLLLPLLISQLAGKKEGEDANSTGSSTPAARDEDILA